MDYPDISSDELLKALRKLGFQPPKTKTGGSHKTFFKVLHDDRTVKCTIVLNKKSIPKGTLENLMDQGEIELEEFMYALGGRHKKAAKQERKRRSK